MLNIICVLYVPQTVALDHQPVDKGEDLSNFQRVKCEYIYG